MSPATAPSDRPLSPIADSASPPDSAVPIEFRSPAASTIGAAQSVLLHQILYHAIRRFPFVETGSDGFCLVFKQK